MNSNIEYKIGASGWDPWPREGVSGQYCEPASTARYPDPEQPDLQFFKPGIFVSSVFHDELRKRCTSDEERQMLEMIKRSTDICGRFYGSLQTPPPMLCTNSNPERRLHLAVPATAAST
jgi:hypothetical protein